MIDFGTENSEQTGVVVSHGGIIQMFVNGFSDDVDNPIAYYLITESELEIDNDKKYFEAKIILKVVTITSMRLYQEPLTME